MLELIEDLPDGVVGVKAVGTVTREDYIQVLEPLMDTARREGHKVRLLYYFGPEFERFSAGGAWEDARMAPSSLRLMEGCAVVSDVHWIRESVNFARLLMPCPMRVFASDDRDQAAAWLAELPQSGGLTRRLLTDIGVLVVEPQGPLRATDFDHLALLVDPWIESEGELNGLVIHAEHFPGWESIGGFIRHAKFLRDHHRKIDRVALATDIKLAELAPHLAEHFVKAEIRSFGYDELDAAVAWAAEG
ncbi:STAS/SEC14 domain-containing protein [Pseudenhygromyxa sp. WMMC2535]|uniref:STAS/SEC14 domain-containing protein n=1 Tax=Pseudenhygromyxa sp. WMMC2535 TaxID=2712867 RepID=UPI001554DA05|nr:STAS/SEC14 domain-containing protein [Pseudenhygromyxa sp. WMMC2535]NVB37487.1 STAS/SEC14 domain-containing protein [Pseudenhygromyxa sp. WMMC2535]